MFKVLVWDFIDEEGDSWTSKCLVNKCFLGSEWTLISRCCQVSPAYLPQGLSEISLVKALFLEQTCFLKKIQSRDFPDSPVVRPQTSIAGSVALIPGGRTKIPQARYQLPCPHPAKKKKKKRISLNESSWQNWKVTSM